MPPSVPLNGRTSLSTPRSKAGFTSARSRRKSSARSSSNSNSSASSTSSAAAVSPTPPPQPPPPPPPRVEITVAQSVSEIPAGEWDALVRAQGEYNPCVSHAFLDALEASGSAAPSRGWLPHHLVAREVGSGRLVGAAPLYLKGHSRGEYVFDQGWADASHRMGVPYFPKAVGAVPMTPVSGPRLLAVDIPQGGRGESSGSPSSPSSSSSSSTSSPSSSSPPPGAATAAATADSVRLALADALVELSTSREAGGGRVSGAHVLFCSEDDAAALAATGAFKQRLGLQYHWFNDSRGGGGKARAAAASLSSSSPSSSPSPPSTSGEKEEESSSSSYPLYSSFEDFLSALRQSKRKLVRQERKRALSSSSSAAPFLAVSRVRGTDLRSDELRAFYGYYVDTCERRWGQDYLTESFFMRLAENPDVLLVLASEPATTEIEARRNRAAAEDGLRARRVVEVASSSSAAAAAEAISPPFTPFGPRGRALAGALNLVGSRALFGRNWGCDPRVRDVPFLHFELSYYQAIEAAIEAGLPRVEAGAQGEHKIARGYVPTFTRSMHCLRERSLDAAVAQFLRSEAREVEYVLEAMSAQMSPYKK